MPQHRFVRRNAGRSPARRGRRDQSARIGPIGRKSGERYLFPLFYGRAGDGYFVIASKGGAPEHPGWYRNLRANPEVEIQVGTKTTRASARTASGSERAELWEQAVQFFPPYADYQRKAQGREIPVVVLHPIH